MKRHIFVMTGPSGSGKTSVIRRVLNNLPNLYFSVSYTTRPQKRGEREGVDYHYIDTETFQKMVQRGSFLEWAFVHHHYYGTAFQEIEKAHKKGMDVLLDIDVQGAIQVRKKVPEAVQMFLLPPSFQSLKERLIQRERDNPEEIKERLRAAYREIQCYPNFDYVIMNDDLDVAVQSVQAVILAHRVRRWRMEEIVRKVLSTFKEEP